MKHSKILKMGLQLPRAFGVLDPGLIGGRGGAYGFPRLLDFQRLRRNAVRSGMAECTPNLRAT